MSGFVHYDRGDCDCRLVHAGVVSFTGRDTIFTARMSRHLTREHPSVAKSRNVDSCVAPYCKRFPTVVFYNASSVGEGTLAP